MSDRPTGGSPKARARAKTEQMRAERAAEAARQQRNQRLIAIVGGVVILGLVGAIIFALVRASGGDDEAANTATDGEVVVPSSVVDDAIPVGEDDAPVTVDLYYDYMCPACGGFEQVNGEDLTRLVEDGTAKVNLHVMNFLDGQSDGTQYSTRAGNAIATVADQAPEAVWDFHQALYANQPQEGTSGLSDEQIADIAEDAGVPSDVADSFVDGTHNAWVAQSNEAAGNDGVTSTPTLRIDGEEFAGDWGEPGAVAAAIEAAAGE